MKNIILLLQFICILLLVIFNFTGKNNILPIAKEPSKITTKDIVKEALTFLKSDNPVESEKGARQILEIKKAIEEDLSRIITVDKVTYCYHYDMSPAKLNAIKLSGFFYNQKTIELLYDNIFYGIGSGGNECLPDPLPPAIESLIAIGKPSADFIGNRINTDTFGKISYGIPAGKTARGVVVDKIYIDQYIEEDIDLYIGDFYKLVINGIYSEPKYWVQEMLNGVHTEHEREIVKKNLKKMLLYE